MAETAHPFASNSLFDPGPPQLRRRARRRPHPPARPRSRRAGEGPHPASQTIAPCAPSPRRSCAVSGGGLVLPRLIAIGDPELDDRIGGALDPLDLADPLAPAIDPLERQLRLALILRGPDETAAEAMRLAADLGARARRPGDRGDRSAPSSRPPPCWRPNWPQHWSRASRPFPWLSSTAGPASSQALGRLDSATRRGQLLRAIATPLGKPPARPGSPSPPGSPPAAPAVAALLAQHRAHTATAPSSSPRSPSPTPCPTPSGTRSAPMTRAGASRPTRNIHLKRLLDRIGVARGEVEPPGPAPAAPPRRRCAAAPSPTP